MASSENLTLRLEGRITAHTATSIWGSALDTLASYPDRAIVIDASRLEYIDTWLPGSLGQLSLWSTASERRCCESSGR